VGMRYKLYSNLYVTGKANWLYHNFIRRKNAIAGTGFLSGYSITLGYKFLLGPLELSAMYSDQSKKILPYINLGISF